MRLLCSNCGVVLWDPYMGKYDSVAGVWDSYVGDCGVVVDVFNSCVHYCGVVIGVCDSYVGYCGVVLVVCYPYVCYCGVIFGVWATMLLPCCSGVVWHSYFWVTLVCSSSYLNLCKTWFRTPSRPLDIHD